MSGSKRVWMDISQEKVRIYRMIHTNDLVIKDPMRVGIKRTFGQDSHVVWDGQGNGHYIAAGEWAAISWTGYDEADESFGERLNNALEGGARVA